MDNDISVILWFCGQMCKMSMLAPTISAVRLWKVGCCTGHVCSLQVSRVISVSFVVEINVSPLNWRMETFENKYQCPMVML